MKKLLIALALFTSTARAADTTYVLKRLSPVPSATNNSADVKLDLNGSWFFNPAPQTGFENQTNINTSWKKIEVPGEWVMQGFNVEKNHWAGYARTFMVPANWNDKRVKLRCDGVYSESYVYINGKKVGYHLGGFTPFEFDITDFVKPNSSSIITVKVRNESIADSLASGSQYAVHPLGGISRKIYLMAVPDVNVSTFHVVTTFDTAYQNATLKTEVQLANDGKPNIKNFSLLFELLSPKTNEVVLSKKIDLNNDIAADNTLNKTFEFPITQPKKWDPEHPNLYTYKLTLNANNSSETVERKIGFKQVEIRGTKEYVNGMPIKLRGACRHETDPLRGRSLMGNEWVNDVLLFREENVNYIRTSHYPPPEEFIHACDSLGMFVEVEAPFCWADGTNVPDSLYKAAILDQTLDMINFFRSDVAVLDWSIANESQAAYNRYFHKSAALVKQVDPTRPRVYNQYGGEMDNHELELVNFHYPGPAPSKFYHNDRPIVFNEYSHLNAYNRLELVTDPGLRDAWGIGFKNMWEGMYAAPDIVGGCIWAGIDDSFILPDGRVVGYGTWGPLDDWRRKKPEYWHVKKTYSPVKIELAGNYKNDSVQLVIENRMLFSNLNEANIKWHAGKFNGVFSPSIEERKKDTVAININGKLSSSDTLFMDVYDPRNVLIDQYAFEVVPKVEETVKQQKTGISIFKYSQSENTIVAQNAGLKITVDKQTGNIEVIKSHFQKPMFQMGALMLLPLNPEGRGTQMTGEPQVFSPFTNTGTHRIVKKVEYNESPSAFTITVHDNYDEAWGYTTYEFSGGNNISIHYHYTVNKDINPRQWGIVVSLANDFNSISWKRKGIWNYYPHDHIGRLVGTAKAFSTAPISGPAGAVQKPTWPWSQDRNELGTNDFRSTKMNIFEGSLQNGRSSLQIISNGSQSMRAWKEDKQTKVLLAGYSNLGAERFFRGHAEKFDKPLKQGDVIEDTVDLTIE